MSARGGCKRAIVILRVGEAQTLRRGFEMSLILRGSVQNSVNRGTRPSQGGIVVKLIECRYTSQPAGKLVLVHP